MQQKNLTLSPQRGKKTCLRNCAKPLKGRIYHPLPRCLGVKCQVWPSFDQFFAEWRGVLSLAWAFPVYWLAGISTFGALFAGGAGLLANWLLLERLTLFADVPPEWMPRVLAREALSILKRDA